MTLSTAIVWFRRDLRLSDNPALLKALDAAERVIPVFIEPVDDSADWCEGSASRWWLHHSLLALDASLLALGSRLIIRRGPALEVLQALVAETGAESVFWNRLYDPQAIVRDTGIKQTLRGTGIRVETFNSALLYEPWSIRRPTGGPYRVFTPFWKALLSQGLHQATEPAPRAMPGVPEAICSEPIDSLGLLPGIAWDAGFYAHWQVGEAAALGRLEAFAEHTVLAYKSGRDVPGEAGTSRLSPYLHFGEISPRQVLNRILDCGGGEGCGCYAREIGWREFGYHLLFHFPQTADAPMDERFLRFPWRTDYAEDLLRWQRGLTGYPIVDAGMRELWHTGWMHNRVRMIVASFLTKNLLIPWQEGARWFWDTLVDADLASNTLGWQWTAGCGADAAPFFRIFNPVLQGERFDPEGQYVRQWVPELAKLPASLIHKPWEAQTMRRGDPVMKPGDDYPKPMVDLKLSRDRALSAFSGIKSV